MLSFRTRQTLKKKAAPFVSGLLSGTIASFGFVEANKYYNPAQEKIQYVDKIIDHYIDRYIDKEVIKTVELPCACAECPSTEELYGKADIESVPARVEDYYCGDYYGSCEDAAKAKQAEENVIMEE